jgi:hypothetical protein
LKDSTVIKVAAITCISAVEIANLLTLRVDSTVISVVVAVVAGLAGYTAGKRG